MCFKPLNKAYLLKKIEVENKKLEGLNLTSRQMEKALQEIADEVAIERASIEQWEALYKNLPPVKNNECLDCPFLEYDRGTNDGICRNPRSNYDRLKVMDGPNLNFNMASKPCVY